MVWRNHRQRRGKRVLRGPRVNRVVLKDLTEKVALERRPEYVGEPPGSYLGRLSL